MVPLSLCPYHMERVQDAEDGEGSLVLKAEGRGLFSRHQLLFLAIGALFGSIIYRFS